MQDCADKVGPPWSQTSTVRWTVTFQSPQCTTPDSRESGVSSSWNQHHEQRTDVRGRSESFSIFAFGAKPIALAWPRDGAMKHHEQDSNSNANAKANSDADANTNTNSGTKHHPSAPSPHPDPDDEAVTDLLADTSDALLREVLESDSDDVTVTAGD